MFLDRFRISRPWALAFATGLFASVSAPAHAGSCLNTDTRISPVLVKETPANRARAHKVLRQMVAQAIETSHAVGSTTLLTQAAQFDLEEAKAGRLPAIDFTANINHENSKVDGLRVYNGEVHRTGLSIRAPLFDSGRTSNTIAWRQYLAAAARENQRGSEEQIAYQTIALALDRSRYFKQGQIFEQHAKRLKCLVKMLKRIVKSDGGRLSELVQAKKTWQQAQLAFKQSQSTKRQIEHRLRHFVGDKLPRLEGMTTVLNATPDIAQTMSDALNSSELNQLKAQAKAADSLAHSIAAKRRFKIDWAVHHGSAGGVVDNSNWQAGINITIPLFNRANSRAADAANMRAMAAELQRADRQTANQSRINDIHDQAEAFSIQAQDVDAILTNSERLRGFTLTQWRRLGRRSLFDVMSAERDHYGLRIAHVNALHDRQLANVLLWSLGKGINAWLAKPSQAPSNTESNHPTGTTKTPGQS